MVLQKKGTPMKQVQKKGKKPVQIQIDSDLSDMEDFNLSDDSEDNRQQTVQKTPTNKGAKLRQSMSEKKVSFQMTGKSPASKTPQKNQQPTPAKGNAIVQKSFDVKGKNKKAENISEDEEEDYEDDDDSFDDLEMDVDGDEEEDSEDDEDSEDNIQQTLQKTPTNKGAKTEQSMSEKKVSFQVTGKSPASKTPQKNKQSTPAKGNTTVQKSLDVKGKNKAENVSEDEEDDDDSSDDLNLEIDVDDEEEEEDTEDEEEGTEDEEDDDEEENVQKRTKQKTPAKAENLKTTGENKNEKKNLKSIASKDIKQNGHEGKQKTPKVKNSTASPDIKSVNVSSTASMAERTKNRDATQLYVGLLPVDVTHDDIKSLSPDIVRVHTPHKRGRIATFAFLTFESEAKAEENYEILKTKKYRGQLLKIDYVGEKSAAIQRPKQEQKYDMRKLHVPRIPPSCTLVEVARIFPTAVDVALNDSSSFRIASIAFSSENECAKALENAQDAEIQGEKIDITQGLKTNFLKKKHHRTHKDRKHDGNPSKKMKFSKSKKAE